MPLKIVHLSDLLIGDADVETVSADFQSLFAEAELVGADYLIICGNLTISAQHLPKLVPVLDVLTSCLSRDHVGLLANRLVLLPGRFDADDPDATILEFSEFKRFYDGYFKKLGLPHTFDATSPIVRHLRDLTLVGIHHLNPNTPPKQLSDDPPESLSTLAERLRNTRNSLPFAESQPCVLATTDSPLLHWELRSHAEHPKVRDPFKHVDLHLFGADRVTYLANEPFSFGHPHFGTGPRVRGHRWPLRANVLALTKVHDADTGVARLSIDATAYKKTGPTDAWRESNIVLPRHIVSQPPCPEKSFLHQSFLDDLQAKLRSKFIRVTGFSGTWPIEVAHRLANNKAIGEKNVLLSLEPISTYSHTDEFITYLGNKLKQAAKENPGCTLFPIIIDVAFRETRSVSLEACQNFRQRVYALTKMNVHFIHLLEAYDRTLKSLPEEAEIPFPSFDANSFRAFEQFYVRKLPLALGTSALLTKGYFDFTLHFFESLSDEFKDKPGPMPISKDSQWELIGGALENSSQLRRDAKDFMTRAQDIVGGRQITDHLRGVYASLYKGNEDLRKLILETIQFSPAELSGDLKEQKQLQRTAEKFAHFGIFERANGCFVLREKLPFLMDTLHRVEEDLQDIGAPAFDECYVFLSYDDRDVALAKQVKEHLNSRGIYVWWAPDNIRVLYREEINQRLTKAACVLTVWTKLSIESAWVREESDHGVKNQTLISVRVNLTVEELPLGFGETTAYAFDDPERYIRAVREVLRRCKEAREHSR